MINKIISTYQMIRLFDHQRQARVRLAQMRQNTTESALLSSSNLLFAHVIVSAVPKKMSGPQGRATVWFRD